MDAGAIELQGSADLLWRIRRDEYLLSINGAGCERNVGIGLVPKSDYIAKGAASLNGLGQL